MFYLLDTSGSVPMWPLILLAIAAAIVLVFMVIQLRRIVRGRKGPDPDDK